MKNRKKGLRFLLCLLSALTVLSAFSLTASAANRTITVSVSDAIAIPGDEVIFSVYTANNPGVMAVTVSVNFDPSVLQYVGYVGGFIPKDTIGEHTNHVTVVWCGDKDVSDNGRLFSVRFKVLNGAQPGKYAISIKNNKPEQYGTSLSGCFANWNRDTIQATAQSGTLTVREVKKCSHSFGAWKTQAEVCKSRRESERGIESRTCKLCGHTELRTLTDLGHSYENIYTVDRAATDSKSGLLSKHCIRCNQTTGAVEFSKTDAVQKKFSNTVGTKVSVSVWNGEKEETSSGSNQNTSSASTDSKPSDSHSETQSGSTSSATASEKGNTTTSSATENIDKTTSDSSPSATDGSAKTDSENFSADELVEAAKDGNTQNETADDEADTRIISMWEFCLGKNGEGGLLRSLTAALPHFSLVYLWLLIPLLLILL